MYRMLRQAGDRGATGSRPGYKFDNGLHCLSIMSTCLSAFKKSKLYVAVKEWRMAERVFLFVFNVWVLWNACIVLVHCTDSYDCFYLVDIVQHHQRVILFTGYNTIKELRVLLLILQSQVIMAVLGSLSLIIVLMVSVDVQQHSTCT